MPRHIDTQWYRGSSFCALKVLNFDTQPCGQQPKSLTFPAITLPPHCAAGYPDSIFTCSYMDVFAYPLAKSKQQTKILHTTNGPSKLEVKPLCIADELWGISMCKQLVFSLGVHINVINLHQGSYCSLSLFYLPSPLP